MQQLLLVRCRCSSTDKWVTLSNGELTVSVSCRTNKVWVKVCYHSYPTMWLRALYPWLQMYSFPLALTFRTNPIGNFHIPQNNDSEDCNDLLPVTRGKKRQILIINIKIQQAKSVSVPVYSPLRGSTILRLRSRFHLLKRFQYTSRKAGPETRLGK